MPVRSLARSGSLLALLALARCQDAAPVAGCPDGAVPVDGGCAACATDEHCPALEHCDGAGQCAPAHGLGDPCDRDRVCTSRQCGPGGACLGALGETCDASATCASGACAEDRCCDGPCDAPCEACGVDGRCTPVAAGDDPECASTCLEGACLPCAADTVLVGATCVDRFEAPNREGASPLVMYTFLEAEAWCAARGKRLCGDDEWTVACAGPEGWTYPYGDTHVPGTCRDEATWLTYDQGLLNGWPASVCTTDVTDLEALLDAARAVSAGAAAAADHVAWLYQAEPAGANAGCTNDYGVVDLQGNVEEWTRRADGGEPQFHGNLKGRYWAEVRTCQGNVTVHGDGFRFYEIGFRCCSDPISP